MDALTFETRWAVNSEIIKQVTSSWSIFIQVYTHVYMRTALTLTLQYIATGCTPQKHYGRLHIKQTDILWQAKWTQQLSSKHEARRETWGIPQPSAHHSTLTQYQQKLLRSPKRKHRDQAPAPTVHDVVDQGSEPALALFTLFVNVGPICGFLPGKQ